jgi:hypothetical protein
MLVVLGVKATDLRIRVFQCVVVLRMHTFAARRFHGSCAVGAGARNILCAGTVHAGRRPKILSAALRMADGNSLSQRLYTTARTTFKSQLFKCQNSGIEFIPQEFQQS